MMKKIGQWQWKKYWLLGSVGSAIPAILILGIYLNLAQALFVPLVIIFSLVFSSMALWSYANRKADGSEWWQDDNASGWRGY